jgi:alcohol dehydrogenase class IV
MPASDGESATNQTVYEDADSAAAVAGILSELGSRRAMFVVDGGAYRASGAEERFRDVQRERAVTVFEGFEINPKIEDVERGVATFRQLRPDAVVAIGGGSALDMAKLIAACGPQESTPRECATGVAPLVNAPSPVVAIPTTAGTGSEATHFAVVYVDGKKLSLADPRMRPDYVVLDPTLTHSLPRSATVASGLDALCQSIESIWAVGSTDASLESAYAAFDLALRYLPLAAKDPDPDRRAAMLRAAHYSGRAIDVTKTTAPHACSYSLTTRYGTPHGLAVALTLGPFLRWNGAVEDGDCNDPHGARGVRERISSIVARFGTDSIDEACRVWEEFLRRLGAPTRLREVGVAIEDLSQLADDVNVERLANNPRRIDRDALVELLRSVH